ncbi:ribose 5-phosphate isomerase B [Alkalibaculum sp. M08DMB]|uniref:Ribose 5-phosphate isomerase B n=1 Tax=Alkalibaculum sporogenes TaxID=2655001 RepID=A0A6A7K593_9FIRM|nr:ribose 5-phosphate isomerase B [Alkalibaculum sporogenes]MPW24427.1 ribose 5-phosphate isomerase B [Alkalibaculum sporogenes]
MKIGFGCDHVSMTLKNILISHLESREIECIDYGPYTSTSKVNYPEYGLKVAEAIIAGECDRGVLVCGTGVGISLAANKVPGIRAVVCSEPYTAKLSKEHNNSNILSMGERVVGAELAKMILDSWIEAEFEGGRHQDRVNMIADIERKYGAI